MNIAEYLAKSNDQVSHPVLLLGTPGCPGILLAEFSQRLLFPPTGSLVGTSWAPRLVPCHCDPGRPSRLKSCSMSDALRGHRRPLTLVPRVARSQKDCGICRFLPSVVPLFPLIVLLCRGDLVTGLAAHGGRCGSPGACAALAFLGSGPHVVRSQAFLAKCNFTGETSLLRRPQRCGPTGHTATALGFPLRA